MGNGPIYFMLWMNQELPLSSKNPLFLSLCTYVGCVVSCHDNSPLLPAYLGLALCLLTGAWQPRGLRCCSPMTVWWSFIANSSVSKSLLLSSLFWFMYSLIYLCMWTMGREERRERGRRGWKKGRRQQLQYLLLYPRERLQYICLLKASAQTGTAQKQTTTKPPHVNRNSVRVLFAQTKKGFFQLRPGSMKRVKRCCSPLWELQKAKARKKETRDVVAISECCTDNSDPWLRWGSFAHNLIGFRLPLPISETSRGKTDECSTSTCTVEQTNLQTQLPFYQLSQIRVFGPAASMSETELKDSGLNPSEG